MYRGCADSGGCHRCRLDGSGTASAGRSGKSGAAGFADPARPAARSTVGRARHGHPAAIGAGCRGAQSAGAGHQRRGRGGHRLSAAGDRAACRRPGRARGAAAADRRGAPGDPAALPRRRLCAHHRLGATSTTTAGCASSSPRAASPASSWTATSARPATQVLRFLNRLTEKQPIDTVTLERYLLLAQDVPGCQPARRAGAVHRHSPAR